VIAPFDDSVPHVGRATIQMFFVTCSAFARPPAGRASLSVRITAAGARSFV
jgi:hypothetical protein